MICPTCRAEISSYRVPYKNIPACDCCGEEGAGIFYMLNTRKSLCQACYNQRPYSDYVFSGSN
jgi:hypothetical protein